MKSAGKVDLHSIPSNAGKTSSNMDCILNLSIDGVCPSWKIPRSAGFILEKDQGSILYLLGLSYSFNYLVTSFKHTGSTTESEGKATRLLKVRWQLVAIQRIISQPCSAHILPSPQTISKSTSRRCWEAGHFLPWYEPNL